MTDKTQPTAHAEITAPISADLRRIDDAGAKSAPITLMTEDRACKWAWDQVREDVGTEGWTTSESCNFYGFFMWGWIYRGQYETQRPPAPPAPAAVAVPQSGELDKPWQHIDAGDLDAAERMLMGRLPQLAAFIPRDAHTLANISLHCIREVRATRAALAAAPAQAVAVPPLTPDEARKAAQFARLMNGPSDTTQPSEYAMAGALALAAKLATPAQAPEQWIDDPHDIEQGRMLNPEWVRAQEHATQLAGQGQTFAQWWDEQRKTAAERAPGDDWMDLNADDRDQYEAAFSAGKKAAAPAQAQEDARDAVRALIATHAEMLEDNAYAYFELAYTRQTGWMAWITDKPLYGAPVVNPDRKVLARGQGDTPDEACADAARAAQGGDKP